LSYQENGWVLAVKFQECLG